MLILFIRSIFTGLGIIALSCMAGAGAACGWILTFYLLADKTTSSDREEVE